MTAVSEHTDVHLGTLVREHQADIWRYLRYLGASAADADDLTQETFLAVSRATFCERSRPETAAYLRTVARNQLLMTRRREGREVNTVDLAAAEGAWATTVGNDMDGYLAALADCLAGIDGRARKMLDRFYQEGEGRGEIALALDMKPAGVKTLLRRTRQRLRSCIEQKTKSTNRQ